MELGFVALVKMGLNMVTRLLEGGHRVVAFDPNAVAARDAASAGATSAETLEALAQRLTPPRAVWLMIPAGEPTESTISRLSGILEPGDIIIDGGNTSYHDDIRRAESLKTRSLRYVDVGTSGGIWGLTVERLVAALRQQFGGHAVKSAS